MELPEDGSGSLAGVGARALARVSDFFVSVIFPNVVLGALFIQTIENEEGVAEVASVPFWVILALVAILAAMEIGFVAWKGRTLGMLTGRLRLRPFDRTAEHDGPPPDPTSDPLSVGSLDDLASMGSPEEAQGSSFPISTGVAVRRGLPAVLLYAGAIFVPILALAYILLYLSPLLDPLYKQGWHDKLAGTIVVRA